MSLLRRFGTMAVVAVMVLALSGPAFATQWSVLNCDFIGTNWLSGGNTAKARTADDNGGCTTIKVKVKYKVDGFWYISGQSYTTGPSITTEHVGADDAGGAHYAYSTLGVGSGWKYSY